MPRPATRLLALANRPAIKHVALVCVGSKGVHPVIDHKGGRPCLGWLRAHVEASDLGQRLFGIIRNSEGWANKDLNKFARDVEALCDKYEN